MAMTQQALGNRYFGGPYAGAFANATQALTRQAGVDHDRRQEKAVGGLNSIGALRSGRARTTLRDLNTDFARTVGDIGAGQAGQLASLEAQRAEGDANRGVERERIGSSERIAGDRLGLDRDRFGFERETNTRDFDYRGTRDARGDAVEDRRFGEDRRQFDTTTGERRREFDTTQGRLRERDTREDFVNDRRFGEDQRVNNRDYDYDVRRDARGDMVEDRRFDRDTYTQDREFGYRGTRDARGDFVDDRDFGYGQQRDQRGDYESDRAFRTDEQRFQQQRTDTINAANRARRGSIWGGIARVVGGAALGFATGGPAGAAIGAASSLARGNAR